LLEVPHRRHAQPPDWSRQLLDRLKSIDALHGRERVARVLKDQGFNLR